MFFFRKFFNVASILIGIGLSCMLAFLYSDSAMAADFTHRHSDKCYGYVSEYCTDHGMSSVYSETTAYCPACGCERPMYEQTVYEWCGNGCYPLDDDRAGHYLKCAACGYDVEVKYEEFHYHYYDAYKLLCTHKDGEKLATLSVSAYPTSWTNGAVTLTASVKATASDFKLAGNAYNFGNGYQSGASYAVSGNGTYYVSVADANGDVATEKITVSNIDVTKPVISLAKSTGEWTSGKLKISVNASDAESGLAAKAFSYNGGEYVSSPDYYVEENGTIKVSVKDNAGNVSTASITVSNIDNGAPTVKLTKNTDTWVKGGLTITATASDSVSGLADKAYSFNGGAYSAENALYVTSNGKVSVNVRDKAGNVSSASIEVNNIDNNAPALSLAPDISEWTNTDVKVLVSATDNESGLSDNPYSINGGDFQKEASFTTSSNGTFTVTAVDKVGNSVTNSVTVSNIDKNSPKVKLDADTLDWTNRAITVTASASDAESGIALSGYSFNGLGFIPDNTYLVAANGSVEVAVKDNAGNVTSERINITNIDTVKPELELSRDVSGWVNTDVYVTAKGSDRESGLSEKPYSLNGDEYVTGNVFAISTNGTVNISVADKAGNVTVKSIKIDNIDKIKPTASIAKSTEAWTRGKVTLNVTASDAESGLADKAYSFMNAEYGSGNTLDVSENASIPVRVKDKAGNVFETTITVGNIDRVAPVIQSCSYDTSWTNKPVIVEVKASDGISGLPDAAVSFDGGAFAAEYSKKYDTNGKYSVSVRDKAGNVTEKTFEIGCIDRESPAVKTSLNNTDWTNEDVILTVTAKDTASGVAADGYAFNGRDFQSGSAVKISANTTIQITVRDNAGNETCETVNVANIDKEAPTVTLTKSTEEWSEEGITVSVAANDSLSGLADKAYSYNGGRYTNDTYIKLKKNGTLSVSVRDKAGNVTTQSLEVANIGKDPAKTSDKMSTGGEGKKDSKGSAADSKADRDNTDSTTDSTADSKADTDNTDNMTVDKSDSKIGKSQASKSDVGKASGDVDKSKADSQGEMIPVIDMTHVNTESDAPDELEKEQEIIDAQKSESAKGELSSELLIEIINPSSNEDAAGNVKDFSAEDSENSKFLKASAGSRIFTLGVLLTVTAFLVMSFFNYTYATENGRIKFLTYVKLKKSDDCYVVMIPEGKVKEHGRYNIYLSWYNKLKVKKHKVYVKLAGQNTKIPTDQGRSFSC